MALPDPARSRAVLIGAGRFNDPDLPDLPAVHNNLDGLAACFRDPTMWGLPADHCTVVADPYLPGDLIDPVHAAAEACDDTLLVYYAGHGLIDHDTNELLLAVVGSVPGRSYKAARYEYLRRDVNYARARRRVVILDCCYSGKAVGGMADPTTVVADEASAEGIYLLASAPPNKQSLSPPGELYTAFTGALLTLFNTGLADAGPELRLDIIYRHVLHTLRGRSRPEPQRRAGNTAGDLALIRNRSWQQAPSATAAMKPFVVPVLPPLPKVVTGATHEAEPLRTEPAQRAMSEAREPVDTAQTGQQPLNRPHAPSARQPARVQRVRDSHKSIIDNESIIDRVGGPLAGLAGIIIVITIVIMIVVGLVETIASLFS